MEDKFTAEFTSIAKDDLNMTLDYIEFELSNPKAAYDFASKVFECVDRACKNPLIYPIAQNELIADADVRRFVVGNYKVFYRAKEKRLIVLRLIYTKRDMQEIFS